MYTRLPALLLLTLVSACEPSSTHSEATATSTESPFPKPALVYDVTQLAGKSPQQVQQLLGKPDQARAEAVRTAPCGRVPCGRHTYQQGRFDIVFIQHKADWITINGIAEPLTDEAIQALGLPATTPSFQSRDNVIRWRSVKNLQEVSAFSNGSGGISYFYVKCTTL
ncbi:hypothetical protein [Hymenobacter crusticola]|uniref:Lipoprotein SmpA/OmlA domain-containing protein n=1 Tax=Hymenobacter crusticola TaxID=1770526 RepID=A0A243W7C9_9BACT|nr:hypothetical protein [Hymenobacter crusticola]OUJ68994.1 hypothetical protein BXP70_27205 [Hymenobacter crusticola]